MRAEILLQAQKLAELPYTVEVAADQTTDEEPVYLARVPELEGCIAQGRSIEDALESLHEARVDYISSLLEEGLPVPLPAPLATTSASGASSTILLSNETERSSADSPAKANRLYEASLIAP